MFFVIISQHTGDFFSKYDVAGTGPRWSSEDYCAKFETLAQAQARIDNMHPEYRNRHDPIVCKAYWVEIGGPDKFGKTLACKGL